MKYDVQWVLFSDEHRSIEHAAVLRTLYNSEVGENAPQYATGL